MTAGTPMEGKSVEEVIRYAYGMYHLLFSLLGVINAVSCVGRLQFADTLQQCSTGDISSNNFNRVN